jgi:hypothetical protein
MALIPAPLERPLAGYPGMWQNMEEANSFTAYAGSAIAFGQALQKGSDDNTVVPLTSTNKFVGIALATMNATGTPVGGDERYQSGDLFAVADMGVLFVRVGAGVTKGQQAWYLPSDGKFYGSTGTDRMALPGVEFDQSGSTDDAVPVRIRIRPGEAAITAAS